MDRRVKIRVVAVLFTTLLAAGILVPAFHSLENHDPVHACAICLLRAERADQALPPTVLEEPEALFEQPPAQALHPAISEPVQAWSARAPPSSTDGLAPAV